MFDPATLGLLKALLEALRACPKTPYCPESLFRSAFESSTISVPKSVDGSPQKELSLLKNQSAEMDSGGLEFVWNGSDDFSKLTSSRDVSFPCGSQPMLRVGDCF
jgi:hypothetical protein